jgi:outer membrane protein assembly factor BamB
VDLVGPFNIKKREFLWLLDYHEIEAIWYSFSAVRKDLLYMGTATVLMDSTYLGYHAYNRHTGEVVWRKYEYGKLNYWNIDDVYGYFVRNLSILDFMSPAVWKNLVIFTGGDNAARAFDANNGDLRWEKKFDYPVSSSPTIASGRVYFGLLGDENNSPKLVCISARDGKLLWQMDTEGSILSAPVIAGKKVIFGTDRSVFYVLEQVF